MSNDDTKKNRSFLRSIGHGADKTALFLTNAAAANRATMSGSVDGVVDGVPRPSKGQREPPPRVSKMTWAETLAAKEACGGGGSSKEVHGGACIDSNHDAEQRKITNRGEEMGRKTPRRL
ncbi:hypothetical protein Cob_v008837 [Colletotrichum orbiculare MAFF 240422]|uniref:Uncharacterized protein n=1 Tax=Colletotrichum orbiculare (strain 104-T / ATCC 96160 / CBS 514.97 / LARS 414 / MAFF 240422) TaxID=1213857 RepID=A0A484FKS4_COLOR|nr:hypothetical protein Cob_v008837 [Colletotrichum orbiculare MAFF 240422]